MAAFHVRRGLNDPAFQIRQRNGMSSACSGYCKRPRPRRRIRRTFDIPAMVRLSVRPTWTSLTEAQRPQVTDSFGRYVSAIYAGCFDNYAGQKLLVTGEQPAAANIMVRGQIIKANSEPVKVDYMMRRTDDSWLISDIY